MAELDGVRLKKKYGQHFLRDYDVLAKIIAAAELTAHDSVLEIGAGDGFLTAALLDTPLKRLWSFEIDKEWAESTKNKFSDDRFTLFYQDVLTADIAHFPKDESWTIVANLPYNITFPILDIIRTHRTLFKRGVIMVQEEVAQTLTKKASSGKAYGYVSLFFQHHFEWQLLDKVFPESFVPAPKVYSRLLSFRAKEEKDHIIIPDEQNFWTFVQLCFKQPRRTLRNNLAATVYASLIVAQETLAKRAQQLSFQEFIQLWNKVQK